MGKISTTIRCPSCQGVLAPVALACEACGIRVEGEFRGNEFANLSAEDLHFLRIFVHCEGRIRDMESALGVSYPTIKARLAKLKEALAATAPGVTEGLPGVTEGLPTVAEGVSGEAPTLDESVAGVVRELETDRITFEEAMKKIRELREGGSR